MINFSVIIPHFSKNGDTKMLQKLVDSIPTRNDIEVLVIDNSKIKIDIEWISNYSNITLYYSDNNRGAGGARNVGIENAHGKWLIFADADDYFTDDAFEIFNQYINSDVDLIYFSMSGIYLDTGEYSNRGESYTNLVKNFLSGKIKEEQIRLNFSSPCSKMVRTDLVREYRIRYDEVLASNDVFFSTLVGYYANKILAVDKVVYIATVTRGSLTKRRDFPVIFSRFEVSLRRNKFLKEHGLGKYQGSVMYYIYEMILLSSCNIFKVVCMLFKYRQNPCIGMSKWYKSYLKNRRNTKYNQKYIVK